MLDDLQRAVERRVNRSLPATGRIGCDVHRDGPRIVVHLKGGQLTHRQRRALSVIVLDAVRALDRTYGDLDVVYDDTGPPVG